MEQKITKMKLNSRSPGLILGVALTVLSLLVASPVAHAAPQVTGAEQTTHITLDFKEADIGTVLRVLSIKSHVNIVAGPEVQGTVTIRLENVPWEKALDVVLRTYDYVYERDGNIIRVTTREKMAQEPVITQTYVLNYTRASEVMGATQDMLTERGRIQVAERTNTLVITDIPTNLYRIGQVIESLDRITPQAYIDSKIINTDLRVAENLGIEWQTGGAGNNLVSLSGSSRPTTFPFATHVSSGATNGVREGGDESVSPFLEQFFPVNVDGSNAVVNTVDPRAFPSNPIQSTTGTGFSFGTLNFSGFAAMLQMLKSRSDAKIVSNPRIVVLNNQTARVQVGSDVPLPAFERNETTGSVEITGFSFREVGVVLNVTPHINSQEEILVDLSPEVSSQGDNVNFGDFQVPSFTVTRAVTQVLIRSGETIAIGGLLTDSITTSESAVPGVSRIPLIGKLFRSKRQVPGTGNAKAETLFFVTVTMVDTEGQPMGESAALRRRARAAAAKTAKKHSSNLEELEKVIEDSSLSNMPKTTSESDSDTEEIGVESVDMDPESSVSTESNNSDS